MLQEAPSLSIVIEIAELRDKHGEEPKELADFLNSKVKAKINVGDREISLTSEEKGKILSKNYVRVLLRKFLHKNELKDEFRVIAGKENILVIKERKLRETE
jgi:hypothetical protein